MRTEVPNGVCGCGCGGTTYTRTYYSKGKSKKISFKFIRGHNQRVSGYNSVPMPGSVIWRIRDDTVEAGPIRKLVLERQQSYGVSLQVMGEVMGYPRLWSIKQQKWFTKEAAARVLRGIAEHYPAKPKIGAVITPMGVEVGHRKAFPYHPQDKEWYLRANCQGLAVKDFFPKTPYTQPDRSACLNCPVMLDCFGTALGYGEEHGLWGGVYFGNPAERKYAYASYTSHKSVAHAHERTLRAIASGHFTRRRPTASTS